MRFCFVILFVSLVFSASALPIDSTRTNYRTRPITGAFGGFGFNYTELAGKETFEINMQGGVIYDRWLAGGIHLNTFFTINPLIDKFSGNDAGLLGVYGGLFVMPVIYTNELIHAGFPVFIGYGTVNYELFDAVESTNRIEDSDQYWVIQPGIEVEMNIMKFIRIAVGGYYRLCTDIHLNYETGGDPIVPKDILNNFSMGIKLKFGKF